MEDRTADLDPAETAEWLEALESVFRTEGIERGHYLIERLIEQARRSGAHLPYSATTAYLNTIHVRDEPAMPGEPGLEHRIRSLVRWNALATVVQANRANPELGGHIATFASAATLDDVGFNHFWKGPEHPEGPDLLYVQGHSSPGIYARAFLEGRIDENDLHRFRQEVGEKGLSSYPHPWLMPHFWQFPTVSMGLGPLLAIFQARFMKYLEHRGLVTPTSRKVWCFVGDGESDEPESLGSIGLAAREQLDNLVFVVNCNLQRLDGPVRGNGKIIQELEGTFRGAGWNVIKVVWGDRWDALLAKDSKGLLLDRMESAVDGDYQNYKVRGGAYTREHFFGTHPELLALVANLTDDDIWQLNRGGHDPTKIHAAYHAAVHHKGQPTVILAKTVKGYGMGEAGERRWPGARRGRRARSHAGGSSARHACRAGGDGARVRPPVRVRRGLRDVCRAPAVHGRHLLDDVVYRVPADAGDRHPHRARRRPAAGRHRGLLACDPAARPGDAARSRRGARGLERLRLVARARPGPGTAARPRRDPPRPGSRRVRPADPPRAADPADRSAARRRVVLRPPPLGPTSGPPESGGHVRPARCRRTCGSPDPQCPAR
jgi:transketolase N-terminal domain/subunit